MSICSSGNLTYRCLTLSIIILALVFMAGTPNTAEAQILVVAVGDTVGSPGETNSVITTYLTNWEDEIIAIEIWLYLEPKDIMFFQTEESVVVDTTWWKCIEYDGETCIDAVSASPVPTYWICLEADPQGDCIDSIRVQENDPWEWSHPVDTTYSVITTDTVTIGAIDTVGTLLGGWEQVTTRSNMTTGDTTKFYDVKIIAQANANFSDGVTTPGIPAGQNGGVLFRLLADIEDIDDTVTNRSASINIFSRPPDNFVFTRPNGTMIGMAYHQILDSNFYVCDSWDTSVNPPECFSWSRVTTCSGGIGVGCDSIAVYPDSQIYLDTMVIDTVTWQPTGQVELTHGQLTVLLFTGVCGNVNGDLDERINLADITRLISAVYLGGTHADPKCLGNTNCDIDDKVNLADITRLIDNVYLSKTALCSECCD